MSSDNVELARRGYDAFNRGDIEAVLELVHPDFELHSGADLPDPGVYHGREGFLANFREWMTVFESIRFDPQEFIESGDRLLVLVRVSGRGKGSGAEFEQHQAHVWTARDGLGARLEFYSDRAKAERAAGLS